MDGERGAAVTGVTGASPSRSPLSRTTGGGRARGAELAAELRRHCGPLALRVEHIGSTSIPGMAAKPVYDMQVSVRNLAAAAEAFDAPLAALGLARAPYEADHVPAGRLDPPERWAKRYCGAARTRRRSG